MKIGFLFPGQGAQTLGMGKDLYEKFPEYKEVYDKIEKITGIDVAKITFEDEEKLNQTQYTQICILTMSLAILRLLESKNIKADMSMGLSLGEYTSLIYSKVFTFEDGAKIVETRGKLMQTLCPSGDWSMAAILGMDEEKINEICSSIKTGFVTPANFNCVGQIVVSGEKKAIEDVMLKAKEQGAKKVVELKTAGPFHTIKLKEASNELKKELEKVQINKFETPVIKNLDGKVYNDNDDLKDILANHIISPVRFTAAIQTMLEMGVDIFIEIGPGKTLSGFVKRANKEVTILNINNVETFGKTIEFLNK